MNKKVFGRKLGRSRPAREALFSALIKSFILHGKMVTTQAKAKAIQGDLEHMVTLAKKGDLSSRSKALAYLDNARQINNILFQQIAPVFASKTSGFTRIIRLPERKGDNAKMVRIEWTEKVEIKAKEKEYKNKENKVKKETKKKDKKDSVKKDTKGEKKSKK